MTFEFFMLFAVLFFLATWLFISLAIYCIPIITAYIRRHNNILPIAILTLLLGWTFFGWLAALLWSLNCDVKECECD